MKAKSQEKKMLPRPPIIVVMGHVDHGKTTLLDYIRKTNIAGKEAGGITQSIGAYEIEHRTSNPEQIRKITFIDTPGHEIFSKMRARGAKVADLGILVAAADEGVKPQTQEAIEHLKKANLPFIVAINKIDKPNADPERVKNELAVSDVLLEGKGGDVSWQTISAKTGEGVQELLDLILLSAELQNFKYDPSAKAAGVIIEAKIDSRQGLTAVAILKNGILKTGERIATATATGGIKALRNFKSERVESLEPSAPALILGFETLPQIGEEFQVIQEKSAARPLQKISAVNDLEKTALKKTEAEVKNPLIILKADNAGSLEALKDLISRLTGEIKFEIINSGIGDIKENDLKLASAVKALVAGFRVKLDRAAENLTKSREIKIITSEIIYELLKSLERYLKERELIMGSELEALAVFGKSKSAGGGKKQLIGGRIIRGLIKNKSDFEILRAGKSLGFGRLKNLQRNKTDVPEAKIGEEAGMMIESGVIIKEGDRLKF